MEDNPPTTNTSSYEETTSPVKKPKKLEIIARCDEVSLDETKLIRSHLQLESYGEYNDLCFHSEKYGLSDFERQNPCPYYGEMVEFDLGDGVKNYYYRCNHPDKDKYIKK